MKHFQYKSTLKNIIAFFALGLLLLSNQILAGATLVPYVDSSFGTSGKSSTVSYPGYNLFSGRTIVKSDGSILSQNFFATGGHMELGFVQRTSTGTTDTSFGTNGVAHFPGAYTTPNGMLEVDGGSFLSLAQSNTNQLSTCTGSPFRCEGLDVQLTKHLANGSLDTTFGTNGYTYFAVDTTISPLQQSSNPNDRVDTPLTFKVLSSGKIIVLSSFQFLDASSPTRRGIAVSRFNANGSLDTTFGTNGYRQLNYISNPELSQSNAYINITPQDLYIETDDSMTIGIAKNNTTFVQVKLTANGAIDTGAFTNGFRSITPTDSANPTRTLDLRGQKLSNGKILFFGRCQRTDNPSFAGICFMRYNQDGTVDTNFAASASGNILVLPYNLALNQINFNGSVFDPYSGKIYITAFRTGGIRDLYRIFPYGVVDTSFGSSGVISAVEATPAAVQTDGNIVLQTLLDNSIYRLNTAELVDGCIFNGSNIANNGQSNTRVCVTGDTLTIYAGDGNKNNDVCSVANITNSTIVDTSISNGPSSSVQCSNQENSIALSPITVASSRQSSTATISDIVFEDLRGLSTADYSITATISNFTDNTKSITLGSNPDTATADTDVDAPSGADQNKLFATLNASIGTVTILRNGATIAAGINNYQKGSKTTTISTSTPITLLYTVASVKPGRVVLDNVDFKLRIPAFVEAGNYSGSIIQTII